MYAAATQQALQAAATAAWVAGSPLTISPDLQLQQPQQHKLDWQPRKATAAAAVVVAAVYRVVQQKQHTIKRPRTFCCRALGVTGSSKRVSICHIARCCSSLFGPLGQLRLWMDSWQLMLIQQEQHQKQQQLQQVASQGHVRACPQLQAYPTCV
jgi:hypothetical protein